MAASSESKNVYSVRLTYSNGEIVIVDERYNYYSSAAAFAEMILRGQLDIAAGPGTKVEVVSTIEDWQAVRVIATVSTIPSTR